jgi:hypothetical protein
MYVCIYVASTFLMDRAIELRVYVYVCVYVYVAKYMCMYECICSIYIFYLYTQSVFTCVINQLHVHKLYLYMHHKSTASNIQIYVIQREIILFATL